MDIMKTLILAGAVASVSTLVAGSVPAPSESRDWDIAKAYTETNGLRISHSLNTFWRFRPCTREDRKLPTASSIWGWFLVPGRWRGSGHGNYMHADDGSQVKEFEGKKVEEYTDAWYRRTLVAPADCKGRLSRLYLEGLDSQVELWVNGETVAIPQEHPEGRFLVEITGKLKDGVNEILMRISAATGEKWRDTSGFRGNVWLETLPLKNLGRPVVESRFSAGRIAVRFAEGGIKDASLRIERKVVDCADGKCVYRDEVAYRAEDEIPFAPAKAWSPDSPNLYRLEMAAKGEDGRIIDRTSVRFGWRELRSEGGRFLLNGKPINIFAETGWPTPWSMPWSIQEDYMKRAFRAMKAMNVTAVYSNAKLLPDAFYDWADEEGFLLLYSVVGKVGWIRLTPPEKYLRDFEKWIGLERDSRAAVNHPSVAGLLLDVWYNYHDGTKNPAFVGLTAEEDPNYLRQQPAERKKELEVLAEVGKKAFPELETFTGADGQVKNVYGTHIYHTWGVPPAELSAMFERYSKRRKIPVFVGEMCLPYHGSFSELRNWVNDLPMFTENAARFLGHRAAEIGDVHVTFAAAGPNNDLLAATSAWDIADKGRHLMLSELYSRTLSEYLEATIFPWRYDGVSGIGFFEYLMGMHLAIGGRDIVNRDFIRGADLTKPGNKSEILWGTHLRPIFDLEGDEIGLRPNYATAPFLNATDSAGMSIRGGRDDRYSVEHAYFAGEKIEKGISFVNASGEKLEGTLRCWLVDSANGVRDEKETAIAVAAYSNATFDVALQAPDVAEREELQLKAEFRPKAGQKSMRQRTAAMAVQVFPSVNTAANAKTRIRLVGGTDELAMAIERLGFAVERGEGKQGGVTVFGPHALENSAGLESFAAAIGRGEKVLALEQGVKASPEIRKVRSRRAFINAAEHPVLRGFKDEDFANWRGGECSEAAFGEIRHARCWTDWGGRNMVAANIFHRPMHGNVKSLLVSGFDLHDTPLLEYRMPEATWIASELEIGTRLGKDPVATHLFVRMVRHLSAATRPTARKVAFLGSDRAFALFEKAGVGMKRVKQAAELEAYDTVIVAEPDWMDLRREALALSRRVYAGAQVFCLHSGGDFSSAWLPFVLTTGKYERVTKATVQGAADGVWRNGWGAGDLYWNMPVEVPTFANVPDMAERTTPAVLLQYRYGQGRYVFTTLTPELFGKGEKELLSKPSIGKTDGVISALLTSMGIEVAGAGAKGPFRANLGLMGDLTFRDWQFSKDGKKWVSGQMTVAGEKVRADTPWRSFLEEEYHGVGWYKLNFEASRELVECKKLLYIAHFVRGSDEVWLNGIRLGGNAEKEKDMARVYHLPAGALRLGENELKVRIECNVDDGGLRGGVGIHSPEIEAGRVWTTPWPDGVKRDYGYPCDMIRFY